MLHQEWQNKNYQRVLKMNEYKRQKILEKHQKLQSKMTQRKCNINSVQDCAIKKDLSEKESEKIIMELLKKMKMSDPYKPDQRRKLMKTMTELNKKFGLDLDLSPKKSKKKIVIEEDTDQ